jgi:tetratricopeptide (TPR) repeat protein
MTDPSVTEAERNRESRGRSFGVEPGSAGHPPARGAAPVTWPVRSGRVPPPAAAFTARRETAGDIWAELTAGSAVALISTPGSRGWPCGKTQLAAQVAESLCRSRTVDVLVWVTADSRASVLSGYSNAAASLGLADGGNAEHAADSLMRWLAATRRAWLVVLDDVHDRADLDGLWPTGPSGRVLVTAPGPSAVPAGRGVLMRELPRFSAREAMTYLSGSLTADPDHRAGALDLVGELGCEPAALAHAAAVIADADLTCRDYRHIFMQRREQFTTALSGDLPAAAITWVLSAQHAELIAPGGGTWPMLVLASLLDGHGIPATVLTAPAVCRYLAADAAVQPDPRNAWALTLALQRAGLVDLGSGSDPPLVLVSAAQQAAIRAAAQPGLLERALRTGADALAEAWPEEHRGPLTGRFLGCAASLREAAGDTLWTAGGCHLLLWLAGQAMDAAGITTPAIAWWRQLATDGKRICGPGHQDTLAAAGQMAAALLTDGQAAEAVSWSEWVLDGRSGAFGPDHPATVAAQADLGRALAAVGKPGDAAAVLDGAIAASERVHGADRVTLAVREEHAAACLAAGRTREAIKAYQQNLEARQRLHGPEHPLAVAAGLRLGKAYLDAGRTGEAIRVHQRMLGVSERALGPDHPATLGVSAALASAYASAGRIGEAIRAHEDVCAASERVLGAAHPDTLTRRADLARAYWSAGQAQDALAVLADTISRCESALLPGDPRVGALRQAMAEMTGG